MKMIAKSEVRAKTPVSDRFPVALPPQCGVIHVAGGQLQHVAKRHNPQHVREQDEEEDGPDVVDVPVRQPMQVRVGNLVTNERAHRFEKLSDSPLGLVTPDTLAMKNADATGRVDSNENQQKAHDGRHHQMIRG